MRVTEGSARPEMRQMISFRQITFLLSVSVFLFLLIISNESAGGLLSEAGADKVQQPHPVEIKIDPKLFDQFAGQYSFQDNPDMVLSFWREGGKFFLQATNQNKWEIFPESKTTFFRKAFFAQMTFVRDATGKVDSLIWRRDNEERRLRRISNQPAIEVLQPFEKREAMIPMRDGVRLHTLIFAPSKQSAALPLLFNRTPYGVGQNNSDSINRRFKELVTDGYIFVLQDIRGRFGSEGEFAMNRPPRD